MKNRTSRRAAASKTTFYKVTPMETEDTIQGLNLRDHVGSISYIDTKFNDCLVVLVPATTSHEMARDIEEMLTTALKRNVIVMSENLTLCRVEGPLGKKAVAEVLKAINGVEDGDAEEGAEKLIHLGIVEDEEKAEEEASVPH